MIMAAHPDHTPREKKKAAPDQGGFLFLSG
jgi:hypothetical protein